MSDAVFSTFNGWFHLFLAHDFRGVECRATKRRRHRAAALALPVTNFAD